MTSRWKLFYSRDMYDLPGTETLFLKSMRECCTWHAAHCPEYAAILRGAGFAPGDLRTAADLARLPAIPTVYFKRHALFSMPQWRMPVKATSSGTAGRRSQMGFDAAGLLCGLGMVLSVARYHHLFSRKLTNYIVLGWQPHRSNKTVIAKTAFGNTLFAPALHREYALKFRGGEYHLDQEGLLAALVRYEKQGRPVRLVGFPAYTHFLLKEMERRKLRLKLAPGSMILLGGGWKQFYREAVDKEVLYGEALDRLGIPETHIREFFGAVEHPISYCDCRFHHFHVPVYSRVLIRDVNTLEPLPMGQMGLLNLLTPMVHAVPLLSVMTDDLAVLHPGESCPCGVRAPWLEIIGRVGMVDIKTCAAGAEDKRKEDLL